MSKAATAQGSLMLLGTVLASINQTGTYKGQFKKRQ